MGQKKIKIVGAGLAGCSCARLLAEQGFKVDIFEKYEIGGLCRDDNATKFQYYGPHIFHTSNPEVICFVLRFADFKAFTNRPIAWTDRGLARLPISIETTKDLKKQTLDDETETDNECIFENIIKDYSKKQWGKPADKSVLDRLKVYEGLSGSYFNDTFEGLPTNGFGNMMENMLNHPNINITFLESDENGNGYDYVIWTGAIDELVGMNEKVEWKGTKFVEHKDDMFRPRLAPVYNICTDYLQMTRSTDMDALTGGNSGLILEEIPNGNGKHYPIVENRQKLDEWIAEKEKQGLYCCGRLGTASYFDMDDTIENAMEVCQKIIKDCEA